MGTMEIKYRKVLEILKSEILRGKYSSNSTFPSKAMLIRRFGISNLTAVKVVSKLKDIGLVRSHQGRGTFITKKSHSRQIGLIVPGLCYSEFFPPIVNEISRLARDKGYTLSLGAISSNDRRIRDVQVRKAVSLMVEAKMAGVIYQPFDTVDPDDGINGEVTGILERAGMPIVLLDYDICMFPERSKYDVVGINNADCGFRIAEHLICAGARRIHFLICPNTAPSVLGRYRGLVTAVNTIGGTRCKCEVYRARPDDVKSLKRHIAKSVPDAFMCGSDTSAVTFRKTLEKVGLRVPEDIMLTGFDDVAIARLMTPALTTIHQPCVEIAKAVFDRLIQRIDEPDQAQVEIFLNAPLVIRESTMRMACGRKGNKKGKR